MPLISTRMIWKLSRLLRRPRPDPRRPLHVDSSRSPRAKMGGTMRSICLVASAFALAACETTTSATCGTRFECLKSVLARPLRRAGGKAACLRTIAGNVVASHTGERREHPQADSVVRPAAADRGRPSGARVVMADRTLRPLKLRFRLAQSGLGGLSCAGVCARPATTFPYNFRTSDLL